MADESTPKAATLKELKAVCPGADEKFLIAQLDAEATAQEAATAWMTALTAKNTELTAAVEASKATGKKPGVTPPKNAKKSTKKDEEEDSEPEDKTCDDDMEDMDDEECKDRFEAAVAGVIKNRIKLGRPAGRREAVMTVANKHPALHQRWLAVSNPTMQGKRLIAEKYDALPRPARSTR